MFFVPYQLYIFFSPKGFNEVMFSFSSPGQDQYSGKYLINICNVKNKWLITRYNGKGIGI